MSCCQVKQLTFAKVGVWPAMKVSAFRNPRPFASFHAVNQRCQHAVCPYPRFGPRPGIPDGDRSGLLSHRHFRRCEFLGSSHSTSTFLPSFAPRALPRFIAPMRALTSAAPSSPTNTLTGLRLSVLTLFGLADHSVPNHRTALLLPSVAHYPYCGRRLQSCPQADLSRSRAFRRNFAAWTSPLASRLASGLGRNGFALLRTGRSPPVASHLGRSSNPCRADDAVTLGYRSESDYLERNSTSLTKQLHTRTSCVRQNVGIGPSTVWRP